MAGFAHIAQGLAVLSAVQKDAAPSLRPLREEDLDAIMPIENRAYPFPWTRGIFRDCLQAGYPGWLLLQDGVVTGYGVISLAAGEAHVLNVCVSPDAQGRGLGRFLFRALVKLARDRGAERVFLEVRPSNPNAIALYDSEGFNEIGRRPRYYPAHEGREDAIVMAIELIDGEVDKMPPL